MIVTVRQEAPEVRCLWHVELEPDDRGPLPADEGVEVERVRPAGFERQTRAAQHELDEELRSSASPDRNAERKT